MVNISRSHINAIHKVSLLMMKHRPDWKRDKRWLKYKEEFGEAAEYFTKDKDRDYLLPELVDMITILINIHVYQDHLPTIGRLLYELEHRPYGNNFNLIELFKYTDLICINHDETVKVTTVLMEMLNSKELNYTQNEFDIAFYAKLNKWVRWVNALRTHRTVKTSSVLDLSALNLSGDINEIGGEITSGDTYYNEPNEDKDEYTYYFIDGELLAKATLHSGHPYYPHGWMYHTGKINPIDLTPIWGIYDEINNNFIQIEDLNTFMYPDLNDPITVELIH